MRVKLGIDLGTSNVVIAYMKAGQLCAVEWEPIGNGRRGPVTEAIQRAFFDVINAEVPDTHGWLTYVYPSEAALRATIHDDYGQLQGEVRKYLIGKYGD